MSWNDETHQSGEWPAEADWPFPTGSDEPQPASEGGATELYDLDAPTAPMTELGASVWNTPVPPAVAPEVAAAEVVVPAAAEPIHPEPAPADEPAEPEAERGPAGASDKKTRRPLLGGFSKRGKKSPEAASKNARKGAKKVVGLKIGASQIAAARVHNNGSSELVQIAREPLEHGIVVSGELRDPDALAAALKKFFQKNRLPKTGVRLGISNNRIGVRVFEVDASGGEEQFANAVRFRAQEALPIPLEEAVLDYHVMGETGADGATKKVVLVVAYRDLVERYVAACRKAGIRLLGVDLEAFALLRAFASPDMDPDAGLVVVSVGHDRSTFGVSRGGVCEFTRALDWGGFSLNVAIAETLGIAPSQAEPIKLGLSLEDDDVVPAALSEQEAGLARHAVARQLETFARDLVSSLRFYQSQPDSVGIAEMILTGGTAHMPGFAAELERLIGVPVRVGDPLGGVKVGKKVKSDERLGSLAAAIGLGMEV